MPCYDNRPDPREEEIIQELNNRCDKLANLLCLAGKAYHNATPVPVEVKDWWKEHSECDASRGEPW